MKIIKFGGTSVGSPVALRHVLDIIQTKLDLGEVFIVVCSAMSGVTDMLFDAISLAGSGAREFNQLIMRIHNKHVTAIDALIKNPVLQNQALAKLEILYEQLENELYDVFTKQNLNHATRDRISCFGELLSCNIVAPYLRDKSINAKFVDARTLIKTDDSFGNAQVNFALTKHHVCEWFKKLNYVPIVTGYIASDANSSATTTLGRGGSDYTATILGSVLDASLVEIWTDVDGVMTADPKHVKDTTTIPKLTYEEAIKLSQNGAKVIYSASLYPVQEKNIPLIVKNTFNAAHAGTFIG